MTMRRYGTLLLAAAAIAVSASGARVRARVELAVQPTQIENGYRENNVGVGWLEQFNYAKAADHFSAAVRISPETGIFHFNYALALFYDSKLDPAERAARAAASLLPSVPQPHYVLGLIARAQNRADDAAAEFDRVLAMDPADAASAIGLGQARLQQGQPDAAAKAFREALDLEPYNATAAYNLSIGLSRAGHAEEARDALARFQALRESGASITMGTGYLQQGRYAEAMLSTGVEPELVDVSTPPVRFVDVPFAAARGGRGTRATRAPAADGAVTPIDVDGDGDLDLIEVAANRERLWLNDGRGRFTEAPAPPFADRRAGAVGVAAVSGDINNDGRADLLVLRRGDTALYRNTGSGFARINVGTALQNLPGTPLCGALVDYDHDGDLDVVIPGTMPATSGGTGATRLLRNDGNGRFSDVTSSTRIAASGVVGLVPTDYDERRDVDLLLVQDHAPLALYRNLRNGSFADSARAAALPSGNAWTAVAAGDLNKDGRTDFVFTRAGDVALVAVSNGRARFTVTPAPEETRNARGAVLVDYDNDGLLDLLVITADGTRLLRNAGSKWIDVSRAALPPAAPLISGPVPGRAIAVADFDGDGDEDIVVRTDGGLRLWRNDGGNARPSLGVKLTGRTSNRSGTGAAIDLRAGSLRDHRESWAVTPAPAPADVLFGIGKGRQADVVRVLWPSGTVQAELMQPAQGRALAVTELDRKPSSCPFLYAWNGERFEFITDFLGGGEFGYFEAPGVRNTPDPDEYVRIPKDKLRARNGAYELRVTNELEETLYLDLLRLEVVDVPAGVEVFPDEGLTSNPRAGERLVLARDLRGPAGASDEHGHDVRSLVADADLRAPGFAPVPVRVRGYAMPHSLTITREAGDRSGLLLLTGWTDYAFSTDNFAAWQAGLHLSPPVLEVREADGRWRAAAIEVPVPTGRPQTIIIDLARHRLDRYREFRLVTNMRIYWDQVRFASVANGAVPRVTELTTDAASLRDRGFSRELVAGDDAPVLYDYRSVSSEPRWKRIVGQYTAFGDVQNLLAAVDDRFVIAGPGDEVALRFRAPDGSDAVSDPAPGMRRTFILRADGFSKEMDLYSASPDAVAPLPYHGMPQVPHAGGAEAQRHLSGADDHARVAIRTLPTLESFLVSWIQRSAARDRNTER